MPPETHTPVTPIPPPRYCRRCSYNLAALATPRCPECGHRFDPANPRTTRRRPARRWLRHLRRAAYLLLTLFLLLAAVWGWFYWGWHDEQQALLALKLDPNDPDHVDYAPILTSWPKQHLGRAGFVLDRVDELNLISQDIHDISPVRRFTYLRNLELYHTQIADLSPLSRLDHLESLAIERTLVHDLTPLTSLKKLDSLSLGDTPVTDFSPLSQFMHIGKLNLARTKIHDLAPLADLHDLKDLDLSDCTVLSDIRLLSGLKNLEILSISNTHVNNLSPLADLPKLRQLEIRSTPIEDLSPLATLPNLEELCLDPEGKDFAPLSRLSKFRIMMVPRGASPDLDQIRKILPHCEVQYMRPGL